MKIVLDMQARQSDGSCHRGIGRYTLALSQALVRQAGEHDIHLLVNAAASPHYLHTIRQDFQGLLPPERIHAFSIPLPVAEADLANAWRVRAAERMRETFLLDLQPDIIHVSSLFEGLGDALVTSVHHPELAGKTSVTLHDLIPLMQPEAYLPDQGIRHWYYRKLQSLKNAGLVLAVSDYSRQEGIAMLGLGPERVVTVTNAVSGEFRPLALPSPQVQALQQRFGITRPFILYIGGVEPRKNVDRLIAAYAQLGLEWRMQYQLVIAGMVSAEQRTHLMGVAKAHGLATTDMPMTGMIGDEELVALYNMATLFVFPSRYEGFGLPVLEAMACGTPTLVADSTSLPEVVGWREATFDASSISSISRKLHQGLVDEGFRQALKDKGREQVSKFSWDASARRALEAFVAVHERQQAGKIFSMGAVASHKPRLAFVGCLPPDDSAASQHSARLLPALARYYEIEIITDQPEVSDAWVQANFPIRPRQWLRGNGGDYYQRRVYVASAAHADLELLALMQEQAGTLILYTMRFPAMQQSAPMLYLSHGYPALLALQAGRQEAVADIYPANKPLLDAAMGVIALQAGCIAQAQTCYGQGSTRFWVDLSAEHDGQAFCMDCTVGEHYAAAIECFHVGHPLAREQQLLDTLQTMAAPVDAKEQDWLAVARCMADNRPANAGWPVLLVDVSRPVPASALQDLLGNPPQGYRVEPVYVRDGHCHYARQMTLIVLGLPALGLADEVVDFHAGDIFLSLDAIWREQAGMAETLSYLDSRGVRVYCLGQGEVLPATESPALQASIARFRAQVGKTEGAMP